VFARVTTIATPPGTAENIVRHLQSEVVPHIEQQQDSQGGLWLMDRDTGKLLAITLWKTEEAMRASQGRVTQATEGQGRRLGNVTQSVESFEVVAQV
jgi:hypothetical protein